MGDAPLRHGTAGYLHDSIAAVEPASADPAKPVYIAYRPPNSEFTPPASPQPQSSYAHTSDPRSQRSRNPAPLRMDTAITPAYERPSYSPSPTDSPPFPPAQPSPKFLPRQRAPSLLRHASVPFEDDDLDQPQRSPISSSAMSRQESSSGSPHRRAFYNPLASNPINSNGPSWNSSTEDLSTTPTSPRTRGMTTSSQPNHQPTPLLRAATSIPDYSVYRNNDRTNLSGTYKPNRGNPNWSHTDYYPPPPRPFRGEEPRASFRSGWTNASSSVMEASGTERSSIATARSSVASEQQLSIYSRNPSRDRLRDDSPETIQTSDVAEEEEDQTDLVGDVLDSYFYDEADEDRNKRISDRRGRVPLTPSPAAVDTEPPGLSQTPSRDFDSLDSFHSSENLRQWGVSPSDNVNSAAVIRGEYPDAHLDGNNLGTEITESKDMVPAYLPTPQMSPLPAPHSIRVTDSALKRASQRQSRQSGAWQRSSEEIPRRVSVSLKAFGLGAGDANDRVMQNGGQVQPLSGSSNKMTAIRRDISGLPQLPMNKARLSRQDWAEIGAYAQRHSQKPSFSRTLSNDSTISRNGLQSPPIQVSQPLPELDEDEVIPRRASTSVYDRRSTLFSLGLMASPTTSTSGAQQKPPPPPPKEMSYASPTRPRKLAERAERDRYGFKKASDNISVPQYNAWASKYEDHISRRRNKWVALMSKQGLSTNEPTKFPEMSEKIKRYARKGYPPEWRGAMWWYYSGGQHVIKQKGIIGLYASLVARVNQGELSKDDRDAIERDLDRTFPDNIHFRPEPATDLLDGEDEDEPKLIQDLREVLSCFALNNPNIGYCQSLNFIAGLLLLFLKQDKERAFILLTIITQNHLPGAHARNLANTEVNVLMMLIKDYLPKVWASINDTDLVNSGAGSHAHPNSKFQRQPTVALSCTSWFMSLFVGVLPIETVLRVWDAFLYEGPRALYRYALAIFKLGESEIRKYKPGDGEVFMAVQNLPRRCLDPNVLHDLAFVKKGFGNLSQSVIDQKRMFWREQNKMAHQASIKGQNSNRMLLAPPQPQDEDDNDGDSLGKVLGMGGLRRKASRRFRKMRG